MVVGSTLPEGVNFVEVPDYEYRYVYVNGEPVVEDGELRVGRRMKMTISCDHRVIDGALGARFISYLAGVLTDIRKLIL